MKASELHIQTLRHFAKSDKEYFVEIRYKYSSVYYSISISISIWLYNSFTVAFVLLKLIESCSFFDLGKISQSDINDLTKIDNLLLLSQNIVR